MDSETLRIVGQVAGIGGIALAVLLRVFRDIIGKKIFPMLTKDQTYKLLRLIIVLVSLVAVTGIAAWVWVSVSPAAPADNGIPPLKDPVDITSTHDRLKTRPTAAGPTHGPFRRPWSGIFDHELRVGRVLQGSTESEQSLIFDIILDNASAKDLLPENFLVTSWYQRGFLASVDDGEVLEPIAEYSIEFPIDPDNPQPEGRSQVVYPPIRIAAADDTGPGVTTIRLHLFWNFKGRINWHPSSTWELLFSVMLTAGDDVETIFPRDESEDNCGEEWKDAVSQFHPGVNARGARCFARWRPLVRVESPGGALTSASS